MASIRCISTIVPTPRSKICWKTATLCRFAGAGRTRKALSRESLLQTNTLTPGFLVAYVRIIVQFTSPFLGASQGPLRGKALISPAARKLLASQTCCWAEPLPHGYTQRAHSEQRCVRCLLCAVLRAGQVGEEPEPLPSRGSVGGEVLTQINQDDCPDPLGCVNPRGQ